MNSRIPSTLLPQATLRVGGALKIPVVLKKFAIDPDELLREAGIDPRTLDDPDNLITVGSRARLLSLCVERTGCPHFGLLCGQQMNLDSLGLTGLLSKNSPNVQAAVDNLARYMHLHSQGATVELTVDGDMALWSFDPSPQGEATEQVGDASVALLFNAMRTLCGPRFRPMEVWFARRQPADVQAYQKFFKVPLWFDANRFGIGFAVSWLDVQLTGFDAELQRLLQKQIDVMESRYRLDFRDQVQRVLRSALLSGRCNLEEIAVFFSMSGRSLSRRLEKSGIGYQELLDECRFETARQLLENTTLEINGIAESLGYARSSTFIRAFRRWSDSTPGDWRARHGPTVSR